MSENWVEVDREKVNLDEAMEAIRDEFKGIVAQNGCTVQKVYRNDTKVCAVIENAEGRKWLHIVVPDVHKGMTEVKQVSLRRMSSPRDWKGDAFHHCEWRDLDEAIVKYMGDEYDEEIL